ncbi:hypothetical protein A1OE_444 [Candidatus Endolissoclinum faulkneri L2]|uniref:Uncharacterized protein n=1 Tax=Candidatus Endolissoclinum faulkneri L2 TaxID=1193729 RepID=K7YMA4_9PROT|nr:hypothetical protein A1OE_444 [Candidatus Endolissoclinum faulkneri L2]
MIYCNQCLNIILEEFINYNIKNPLLFYLLFNKRLKNLNLKF